MLSSLVMSLIVTGSIGIDTVHTPDDSAEGILGGSASYFAAAASFHAPVRIVAAVGGDWPADHRLILEGFDNICLGGLEQRQDSRTFAWGGRYFANMNERETLFTELGVLEEAPPPVPDAYRDSEFVFLANTHPEVQAELLSHFPDRKLAVADTMDLWINIAHSELLEVLKQVDGLLLNDSEAEQLTEITNAITAARKIIELGPTFVVVKKGEHGAVLVQRGGVRKRGERLQVDVDRIADLAAREQVVPQDPQQHQGVPEAGHDVRAQRVVGDLDRLVVLAGEDVRERPYSVRH